MFVGSYFLLGGKIYTTLHKKNNMERIEIRLIHEDNAGRASFIKIRKNVIKKFLGRSAWYGNFRKFCTFCFYPKHSHKV